MQTFTLEYIVLGSLDGVTPAPAFSVDPNADDYLRPGKDQLYTQVVQNLGLIDPDFGVGGSQGNRILAWFWTYGPTPGAPGAAVSVVDAQGPGLEQQQLIDLAAKTQAYVSGARLVPQGSRIKVEGLTASAGQPVVVRFNVLVADTAEDFLTLCACDTSGGSPGTLSVSDEGALVASGVISMNFTGDGVTATPAGPNAVNVAVPGGIQGVEVQEEGGIVSATTTVFNFVGPGVTATLAAPGEVDITVPGGIQGIDVQEDGAPVVSAATILNFEGCDVSSPVAGTATVRPIIVFPWAPAIANTAGTTPLVTGTTQRYDASALAPGALVLEFPAGPADNDSLELKEIGNSFVAVTLDGNGANVEGVFVASAPTVSVGLPRVNLQYQYDLTGNIWRIV
jgi:hypothetical protein